MEIIVKELGCKLVPHREGLCYELWKWRPERTAKRGRYVGRVTPAGWVTTGCYPRDVGQGLREMLERSINASKEIALSVEAAVRRVDAISEAISDAVGEHYRADDVPVINSQ